MIFIAHRGNLDGGNRDRENHPDYIIEAVSQGFDVEVDVQIQNGSFFLGHDEPQYEVGSYFLEELSNRLWCHAKNAAALKELVNLDMNCFFHNVDAVVLTSKRYLWTFPGEYLVEGSIAVLPETHNYSDNIEDCAGIENCAGICSDFVKKYREDWV